MCRQRAAQALAKEWSKGLGGRCRRSEMKRNFGRKCLLYTMSSDGGRRNQRLCIVLVSELVVLVLVTLDARVAIDVGSSGG